MNTLYKLRDRIDWLDSQIASLLNERMKAADQIGRIKKEQEHEITDIVREQNVVSKVEALVQHPILKATIAHIYKEILKESRTSQLFLRHTHQPFKRIGIIGLGLIGGSICKCIKVKDPSIEISSLDFPSEDNLIALNEGWVGKMYSNLSDLAQNVELMILASPISTIPEIAQAIHDCSDNLLIMDVASVKENIVKLFHGLSENHLEFIGTHPMAGKETRGFAESDPTLFVDRPWVIVPHKKNTPRRTGNLRDFVLFLGSNPITMGAKVHDKYAALVSHIPAVLSKSYLDFVLSSDSESVNIAGPGFQAFTRLAHDNTQLHQEICQHNHKMIEKHLHLWIQHLINTRGQNHETSL